MKTHAGKDDDLKRDLNDTWLVNMRQTVKSYTLLYFAPDLSANRLFSEAADQSVAEKVLISTMTAHPEVIRREKKTLEDKIQNLEEMLAESNSRHTEQILDVKMELLAEMNKHFAELGRVMRETK